MNESTDAGRVPTIRFAGTGVRARVQLFWQDRHCYWCGDETILFIPYTREQEIEGNQLAHNATMDHDPPGGDYLVLSCAECNCLRNTLSHKVAAGKHITWTFSDRLQLKLAQWLRVGRPVTVELARYVLDQPFADMVIRSTYARHKKRKRLLTTLAWQLTVLANPTVQVVAE